MSVPYKVGDTVIVQYSDPRRGEPYEAAITKVGRKWVHLERYSRFDINTGALDGGEYSSPGRVFRSMEELEAQKARSEAWRALREAVSRTYRPPERMSMDEMRRVTAEISGEPTPTGRCPEARKDVMRIIAMLDRAEGNASVGEMWTETRSFAGDAPVSDIMNWAIGKGAKYPHGAIGTLRLQIDEADQ